jgi:hypothetical protein
MLNSQYKCKSVLRRTYAKAAVHSDTMLKHCTGVSGSSSAQQTAANLHAATVLTASTATQQSHALLPPTCDTVIITIQVRC